MADATGPVLPTTVDLPSGQRLTVRSMADGDVDAIVSLYEGLSAEDRYRRFFSQFRASASFVEDWIERCSRDGFGVVAEVEGDGGVRLVAEAGYVLVPGGDGEFAVTVDHAWRGWLGPFLLELLVEEAAARGVPNLEADVLTENRPMLSVVRHRGHAVLGDGDFSVVRVVIGAASGKRPTWPGPDRLRRLLVEVPGARWVASREAGEAGFQVVSCGSMDHGCPALHGQPCALAQGADVILVALPPSDERARRLVAAHGRLHGGVPVVLPASWRAQGSPSDACQLAAGSSAAEVVAALLHAIGAMD